MCAIVQWFDLMYYSFYNNHDVINILYLNNYLDVAINK